MMYLLGKYVNSLIKRGELNKQDLLWATIGSLTPHEPKIVWRNRNRLEKYDSTFRNSDFEKRMQLASLLISALLKMLFATSPRQWPD
jgi:hypothetical protein